MSTKTAATAAGSTARKVVGSLGVLGAAAAVAGLGTFGSFTDSTSVDTTISSGTVSIDLTEPAAIPVTTAGFVPGDTLTRPVTLVNDGDTALAAVNLSATAAASSVLTTDATEGLQLSLKSCAVAWTQGGTPAAPTWTCASGEKALGSGAVLAPIALGAVNSLAVGGTDHLAFSISLPTAADNAFQGKTAALSLTFTATQRTGTAR
ncbi:TasA family protein [Blastococcus sp. VKM Ac-2987]|uniref:TasA family protein n=1 Tax=Blastococcus sp. VKM Ac-2987 TaxID=3004141 RepID=UPI0022AB4FAE|nr:TasA family protein [Blastococcus sp. VKM Ac-2987]MCZ2857715.1 TasA family protein [Blastococcus sp. VKM Ac-2987]